MGICLWLYPEYVSQRSVSGSTLSKQGSVFDCTPDFQTLLNISDNIGLHMKRSVTTNCNYKINAYIQLKTTSMDRQWKSLHEHVLAKLSGQKQKKKKKKT